MNVVFGALDRAATLVARRVVGAVLDRLDLTQIIIDRVDLSRVVRAVDLDDVVARVDLDAIIARIDLVGLAEMIIDAIDLPAIIRSSTTTMTAESLAGVRAQSAAADARLDQLMDRMLLRRRGGTRAAPAREGHFDGGLDAPR